MEDKSLYSTILAGITVAGAATGVPNEYVNKMLDYVKPGFNQIDAALFVNAYDSFMRALSVYTDK